jgi:hypothetical protein
MMRNAVGFNTIKRAWISSPPRGLSGKVSAPTMFSRTLGSITLQFGLEEDDERGLAQTKREILKWLSKMGTPRINSTGMPTFLSVVLET